MSIQKEIGHPNLAIPGGSKRQVLRRKNRCTRMIPERLLAAIS
jgi:hypothetical protein